MFGSLSGDTGQRELWLDPWDGVCCSLTGYRTCTRIVDGRWWAPCSGTPSMEAKACEGDWTSKPSCENLPLQACSTTKQASQAVGPSCQPHAHSLRRPQFSQLTLHPRPAQTLPPDLSFNRFSIRPSVRPSRPSRLPSAFLTASLLPPLDDSRGPIALSSNSVSTKRRATLPLRCWCVGDHSGLMPCRCHDWPERP